MEERVKELIFSGGKKSGAFDERLSTSCRQFFTQRVDFHAARRPDSYLAYLQANYKPLNSVKALGDKMEPMDVESCGDVGVKPAKQAPPAEDGFPRPKHVLFSPDKLEVAWKHVRSVGAGLCNMGNTCFLNSVLQCLCHTPPLYNYIMSGEHKETCNTQGFCSMCEFHRHCTRAMSGNAIIKPFPIVQNLKAIAKQFRVGRQEDAHEFLRYFVDGLQKSCLQPHHQKLDPHSKATTVVHQIFGGYHRSQVKCLSCKKTSNTFDPLLDVSLDIKNATSLHKALCKFVKPDHLDGENKYACPFCHEMTKAQKKLTIHRLPTVLTVQLKRFDYNSMFGGKVAKPVSYPEHLDMCPFTSDPHGPPSWYSLYGVLVHFGFTCHSGHYYCYVKSATGVWHCMNDSSVTQVSKQTALNQEAYLLFYIKDNSYQPPSRLEGHTQAANKSSLPTIKPDPNFLGTPVKRPGVDKSGVPLVRHIHKPTGVVTPSRQTTPTREFSIPLRKADTAALLKGKKTEVTTALSTGGSPPKATPTPQPSLIPRVIVTPKKLKKAPVLARNTAEPAEVDTVVDKKRDDVVMEVGSVPDAVPPPSPSGQEEGMDTTGDHEVKGTLSDITETGCEEETSSVTCNSDLHPDTPAVDEDKFIGPVLPPYLQALSPFISPHLKPPTTSPVKVARVPPQPQVNKKPVARVLPSLHVQPPKSDTETVAGKGVNPVRIPVKEEEEVKGQPKPSEPSSNGGQEDDDEVSSQTGDQATLKTGGKDSELAKADSTTHQDEDHRHLISQSEWRVSEPQPSEVFGPSLPDDYDSTAHGWTVTTMKSDSSKIFRVRSKKTKKQYRTHRSQSFGGSSESEHEAEKGDTERDKDRLKSPTELKDNRVSSTDDIQQSKKESNFKVPKPNVRDRRHSWSDHRPHSTCEDHARDKKHTRHYSEGEERKEHHSRASDSSLHSQDRHKHRQHHHDSERSDGKVRHRHSSNRSDDYNHEHRHRGWHRRHPSHWDPRDRRRTFKPHSYRYQHTYSSGEEGRGRKNWEHRVRQSSPEKDRHYKHEDRSDPTKLDLKHEKHTTCRHRESGDGEVGRTVSPSAKDQQEESSTHHPPSHGAQNHGTKTPVPEVEWDASLKTKGKEHSGSGDHSHSKWDGSQHSETVDQLTSQSHDKLGDVVKSWDGGENTVDSSRVGGSGHKRVRDNWDEELDQGRVKKHKDDRKREKDDRASAGKSHRNPFQDFHDRKHKSHHRNHHRSRHSPFYRRH